MPDLVLKVALNYLYQVCLTVLVLVLSLRKLVVLNIGEISIELFLGIIIWRPRFSKFDRILYIANYYLTFVNSVVVTAYRLICLTNC